MKQKKRSVGLKAKIMLYTLIPIVISYALLSFVFFMSFFGALHETARSAFMHMGEKYVSGFKSYIDSAVGYLSIVSGVAEAQLKTDTADREALLQTVREVFGQYGQIDGSYIYFEPDGYDGRDAEYAGTPCGSPQSGNLCLYYRKEGGETVDLPDTLKEELGREKSRYEEVKEADAPIYTEPVAYEMNGEIIPMFTIAYPVRNAEGRCVGAVAVDLYLKDIYMQLQNAGIYETGYIIIANQKSHVIFSPRSGDIGKLREELGLAYSLPSANQRSVFINAKSILNGKDSLVTINSVHIPQLKSYFYVSVAAPLDEINADGTRLTAVVLVFGAAVVVSIALLLNYLIGKITRPVQEITESANRIAKGDYQARIRGDYQDELAVVKTSVNAMADNIEAHMRESERSLKILESILDGLDAFIYVTVPSTGEILFINENMRRHFNIQGAGIGERCYKVLQEGVNGRCEFCPCHQLDKEPDKIVVWEEHNTVTKRDYRNTDCYIDWLGGVKVHLQHSVDITDIKTFMNDKITAERAALQHQHEKEQAEESSRMKSEFLANMSHEIRTPMNAIIGMSELLLNEQLSERQLGYVNDINLSSHSLLGIINDILDFSKIESGKLELVPVHYDFKVFLDNISSMFRFVAEQKGLAFRFEETGELPKYLYGDDIRLRQVLTNLCGNAVKFTGEGHIGLTVSVAEGMLIFEIADTGIGIRKEDMPKLFKAFAQADTQKNRSVKGTGLGLAISKSFVEMMGGEISLDSVYGEGTVFTVAVPVVPGDENAVRHDGKGGRDHSFRAPEARILVVDDNEINLKVALGLLRMFSIEADTAPSGREAIRMVQTAEYDLVFMDHMMPEMDGVEATREIRKLGGRYERQIIIALTANAIRGAKEMFLSQGLNGFLSKPIEVEQLSDILQEWLPAAKIEMMRDAQEAPAAPEADASDSFMGAVKNIPGINTIIGLDRMSGMENMYRETLELLYKKLLPDCEKMEKFLQSQDLHNLAVLVHGTKSSLSTVGAMELSKTAAELEDASKGRQLDYCEEHVPGFLAELRLLHERLSPVFAAGGGVPDKEAGDAGLLRECVQKALEAADEFDTDAGLEALNRALEFDYGERVNGLLDSAKNAIRDFDFETAAGCLREIAERE